MFEDWNLDTANPLCDIHGLEIVAVNFDLSGNELFMCQECKGGNKISLQ